MLSNTLAKHYNSLERCYPLRVDPDYSSLVVPSGNSEEAFHRWFHIKEGFSSKLTQRVLEGTGLLHRPSLALLDPFSGGGTVVVSALSLDRDLQICPVIAYGIERNPFLRFVAETKVQAIMFGAQRFREYLQNVLDLVQSPKISPGPVPELSTFQKEDYFRPETVTQLLRLRSAIEISEGSKLERNLARLCLAGTIEPVSALRRDGRALRYAPEKSGVDVLDEFTNRAMIVASDLENCSTSAGKGHVYLGDGRRPSEVLSAGAQFDLSLFSPPYPNNIDYTEVYKLEAWFLGFITDSNSFRRQRLLTLRSHPSIRFPDSYYARRNGYRKNFDDLLAPLLEEIPEDRGHTRRQRMIMGYFDDMLETLQNHRQLLAEHGRLVFVVGNSLHGCREHRFLVAADLIIARLAEMVGYEVESFVVARQLTRRSVDLPLMRESVVSLRKTQNTTPKENQ